VSALALEIGATNLDAESPFEEDVLRTIRGWGYDVEPQVGTAGFRVDIGVRDPSRAGAYVLGVECDGSMYHSSKTARDRDRLRQELLERLGWTIHRIWGTAWYRDRSRAEDQLRAAIESALDGDRVPFVVDPANAQANVVVEPVDFDEVPPWAVAYRVSDAVIDSAYRTASFADPSLTLELERVISRIVDTEGPIMHELLIHRLRKSLRITQAARNAVDRAIRRLARGGELERRRDGVLVRPGRPLTSVRVPAEGEPASVRSADQVPPEEIELALLLAIKDSRSVTKDELTKEVASILGWARRGPDVARVLDAGLTRLQRKGAVARAEDRFEPAEG
jgi:very-short-patch-repair endonuclease